MSAGDTRLRAVLTAIPVGIGDGWNRYDTDHEHVLHLWREGQSWDIRVSKPAPLPSQNPAFYPYAPRWYTDPPEAALAEATGVHNKDVASLRAIEAEARAAGLRKAPADAAGLDRIDVERLARIYHAIRHLPDWEGFDSHAGEFQGSVVRRRDVLALFQPDDDLAAPSEPRLDVPDSRALRAEAGTR